MDIVLNRRGGVPVKEQLVAQLELQILTGAFANGQRLPSVRALARRLRVHPNTVSAAYQDLETQGQVLLKKGSGVFVRRQGPTQPAEARGLDEMIRLVLQMALAKGYSGDEIRAAVERWLAAGPPDRVVVVDPSREMGELLVHELQQALGVRASACTLQDLAKDTHRLSGALVVTLPYHAEELRRLAPEAGVEVITIQVSEEDRAAILGLPAGSIALVVSRSPTVLPFASVLLRSLRGDELLVETRLLGAAREWRRLLPAADIVFADALSIDALRRARPKKLREVRVLNEATRLRLKEALTMVVPHTAGRG